MSKEVFGTFEIKPDFIEYEDGYGDVMNNVEEKEDKEGVPSDDNYDYEKDLLSAITGDLRALAPDIDPYTLAQDVEGVDEHFLSMKRDFYKDAA
jgi:hypothetical protein